MATLSATDFKRRMGEYLEQAQHEPVTVTKEGRKYAVVISQKEFERFQRLEDRYWGRLAEEAEEEGYLTPEETMASIKRRLAEIEAGAV